MIESNFIEIKNLKKSFGSKAVLQDVSLKIPKGKLSFVIGRSGEGKSVTIKHLVGILKPDSGEIWIDGKPMHGANEVQWNAIRQKIGILFQDGALFDSLSVFENVAFPLLNHTSLKGPLLNQEVSRLLNMVGLPAIGDKYPTELSIGERKRVGLARALALKPSLLLYDEPTTSMDPLVSDLIDRLILDTQSSLNGVTSIVISHDIASVLSIADYVFLLHEGKIYFSGTPADLKNQTDPLIVQFLTGGRHGPLDVPLV